jgi:hypothetical protein
MNRRALWPVPTLTNGWDKPDATLFSCYQKDHG